MQYKYVGVKRYASLLSGYPFRSSVLGSLKYLTVGEAYVIKDSTVVFLEGSRRIYISKACFKLCFEEVKTMRSAI